MIRRLSAEGLGTFAVVFSGSAALLVAGERLGDVGVAAAFGVALGIAISALSPAAPAHFNPAVTFAAWLLKRLPFGEAIAAICAQLAGATVGAALALQIAAGRPGGAPLAPRALANGYASLSPGFYGAGAAFAAELALTAIFVLAILGAGRASGRVRPTSPIVAGVAYGLVILVGRSVVNLPANPARAFGAALFAGLPALSQLWLFAVAPLAGAALAALAYRLILEPRAASEPKPELAR